MFMSVAVQQRGALLLIEPGQSQGRSQCSHEEVGADQEHRTSRSIHLAAIQGLHWPEGSHHWFPVAELELRKSPQLKGEGGGAFEERRR